MKYLAIARMAFFREAFYRFELLFNALRAVVTVLVLAAVWHAVYASRPSVAGFTLSEVIIYTCTATALTLLFEVNVEREIGERLRSGNLSYQLLKPVHFFLHGLGEAVGTAGYTMIFSAVPTLLTLVVLFGVPAPTVGPWWVVGLMTIFGFLLFFSFCHLTALTTFFTEDVWGIEYLRTTLLRFFAGGFVPLAFFPDVLTRVCAWLPFPYMIYYPALAWTGKCPAALVGPVLGAQLGWLVFLVGANDLYWRRLVRHVTIHGG